MFTNFEHFSLSVLKKMLVIRAGNHKIIVRIANREVPDQNASSGSGLFVYDILADHLSLEF